MAGTDAANLSGDASRVSFGISEALGTSAEKAA
jgi:hypothetical protein